MADERNETGGTPGSSPESPFPEVRDFEDLPMRIAVDLGRRSIRVSDLLRLEPGAVLALDKLTGEPVDVTLGEETVARAEVVVSGETLAARISRILEDGEGSW
jgi:flagellar motor switch protein FliN/FliY